MEDIQRAVEAACTDLQDPSKREAAESVLLQLRSLPEASSACQFILLQSHNPSAVFHAASALQHVLLRDWPIVPINDHISACQFLLSYALSAQSNPHHSPFVVQKISAVFSLLLKRSWPSIPEATRTEFLSAILPRASSEISLTAKITALTILEGLVCEFNPLAATPLALPTSFHNQCRQTFQRNFLLQVFTGACEAAANVSRQLSNNSLDSNSRSQALTVATTALTLMSSCLSWDFAGSFVHVSRAPSAATSAASDRSQSTSGRSNAESAATQTIQPPSDWLPLLLSDQLPHLLSSINSTLQLPSITHMSESAQRAVRQVMVLLCSVKLPSDQVIASLPALQGVVAQSAAAVSASNDAVIGREGGGVAAQAAMSALQQQPQSLLLSTSPLSLIPSPSPSLLLSRQHASRMLALIHPLFSPLPHSVAAIAAGHVDESCLVDACRALSSLLRLHPSLASLPLHSPASATTPAAAQALQHGHLANGHQHGVTGVNGGANGWHDEEREEGALPPGSLLHLLQGLTCAVAAHGGVSSECGGSEEAMAAVLDILLDAWQGLLLFADERYSKLSFLLAHNNGASSDGRSTTHPHLPGSNNQQHQHQQHQQRQQQQHQLERQQHQQEEAVLLASFLPALSCAASPCFKCLAEHSLSDAASSALQEESEEDTQAVSVAAVEQRMAAIAAVGRAGLPASLLLLSSLLAVQQQQLQQLAQQQSSVQQQQQLCQLMEQLLWTISTAGCLLADEAESETVKLPPALRRAFRGEASLQLPQSAAELRSCAVSVPMVVVTMATFASDSRASSVLSPRLMAALLAFLSRWSVTYLFPSPSFLEDADITATASASSSSSPVPSSAAAATAEQRWPFESAFGSADSQQGVSLLQAIVTCSLSALGTWPGEGDVQTEVCKHLLPSLARRPAIARLLPRLPPWQRLQQMLMERNTAVTQLPGKLQRWLALALCRAAGSDVDGHGHGSGSRASSSVSGSSSVSPSQSSSHALQEERVQQLVQPLVASLNAIASNPNFNSSMHRPDMMVQVIGLLECLRGCAAATQPHTQAPLFRMGIASADSILVLLSAYKHEPVVVHAILKYMAGWVDSQILFLRAADAALLLQFSLRLLRTYASFNIATISLQRSRALVDAALDERCKDILALLRLLTSLTSKDMLDFGDESSQSTADVAQMALLGIDICIPLISQDLLAYPKLCLAYFQLLDHLASFHSDKILALPLTALQPILHTIEYGIKHQLEDVMFLVLPSLAALSSCYSDQVARSGSNAAAMSAEQLQLQQSQGEALCHLMAVLLKVLLVQPLRSETVEVAADAVLPLMNFFQSQSQEFFSQLVQHQHVAPVREQLIAQVNKVFQASAQAAANPRSRIHRRNFRSCLISFVSEVKGMIPANLDIMG